MSCRFQQDEAAYVLGALDPAERGAFEAHLKDCPDCAASVAALGGLPGILAHAPVEELYDEPEPVPESLLPNVLTKVARKRRRNWITMALVAAAATVAIAAATVFGVEAWTSPAVSQAAELGPVAAAKAWGEADLTSHTEGTEIRLMCHHPSSRDAAPSSPGEYQLVVTNASGDTAVAGSWVGDTDGDSQVVLFTRWQPEKIAGLEVQDLGGDAVMRWQR